MNRTLLPLLLAALCLVFPASARALNDWTMIVYMSNDDHDPDIQEVNERHLRSLTRVGGGPGVEVAVQVDNSPKAPGDQGARRLSIKQGALIEEKKLGEINMGSPYALWDCLKWVAKDHPARNYLLIFNSHGSGVFSWRGTGSTGSSRPGAVSFDPSRFVAYDDTDDDCLTVFEIRAVLQAFGERLNGGRKIGLLGFDACLPGTIEAMYQLRDVADLFLGTPDTSPMTGFNYSGAMEEMAAHPKAGPAEIGRLVLGRLTQRTMGAWRLAKVPEVVFGFNTLSMEILKAQKEMGPKFSLEGLTEYGGDDRYWDLFSIAKAFQRGETSLKEAGNYQLIRNAATELEESLLAARLDPGRGAISVAWPTSKEYAEFRKFYQALDFAGATKWDEVLDRRELGMK